MTIDFEEDGQHVKASVRFHKKHMTPVEAIGELGQASLAILKAAMTLGERAGMSAADVDRLLSRHEGGFLDGHGPKLNL